MTDYLRKKLAKRAENWNTPKKPPSQTRSENARKRELARAGVKSTPPDVGEDCHECPRYPCGKTINTCNERSMVHRCLKCGVKVRHRIQEGKPWLYCPVCKAAVKE